MHIHLGISSLDTTSSKLISRKEWRVEELVKQSECCRREESHCGWVRKETEETESQDRGEGYI